MSPLVKDFLDKEKIPYVFFNMILETKEGHTLKKIKGIPTGWSKWNYDKCMDYNKGNSKSTNAMNINLSKSKYMIIDIDNKEKKEEYLKEYGNQWMSKSCRLKLPHLWRLKHIEDKNINKVDTINHIDLVYNNIFEFKESMIENINEGIPVFDKYPLTVKEKKVKEKKIQKKQTIKKEKKEKVKKKIKQLFKTINTIDKKKKEEIEEIAENIDIKYIDNYSDWIKIVWSLASIKNKELAEKISRKSSKFEIDKFNEIYDSYNGSITKGTIFYYSKESNEEKHMEIILSNIAIDDFLDTAGLARIFIKLKGDILVYKNNEFYIYHNKIWRKDSNLLILNNYVQKNITRYHKKMEMLIDNITYKKLMSFMNTNNEGDSDCDTDTEDNHEVKECKEAKAKITQLMCKNANKNGVYKTIGKYNTINDICKFIITEISILDYDHIKFDENPDLMPFKSNVYDLNVMEFREYEKEDYITLKVDYDYIKPSKKQIDIFDKLIKEILPDEEVRHNYIQLLSTGLYSRFVEKFIITNGGGGNGKTALHSTMKALLTNVFYYNAPVSIITEKKIKQGNNPEVAQMNLKKMIMYREPDDGVAINGGSMKELTGGDEINARMNYSNDTNTRLRGTHFFECNKKPLINGRIDRSISRRIIDILFQSTFTDNKEDYEDENKPFHFKANTYYKSKEFNEEYKHTLFLYLINFIKKFEEEKGYKVHEEFNLCEKVKERSEEYILSSDEKLEVIKTLIEKKEGEYISIKDLYDKIRTSDFYENLSKKERRDFNQKHFKDYIKNNEYINIDYKDKYQYSLDGVKTCRRHILLNYKFINEDDGFEE